MNRRIIFPLLGLMAVCAASRSSFGDGRLLHGEKPTISGAVAVGPWRKHGDAWVTRVTGVEVTELLANGAIMLLHGRQTKVTSHRRNFRLLAMLSNSDPATPRTGPT